MRSWITPVQPTRHALDMRNRGLSADRALAKVTDWSTWNAMRPRGLDPLVGFAVVDLGGDATPSGVLVAAAGGLDFRLPVPAATAGAWIARSRTMMREAPGP